MSSLEYRSYILVEGQPVPVDDLLTWAEWCAAHAEERILKKTDVGTSAVFTVFLGLDHRLPGGSAAAVCDQGV